MQKDTGYFKSWTLKILRLQKAEEIIQPSAQNRMVKSIGLEHLKKQLFDNTEI